MAKVNGDIIYDVERDKKIDKLCEALRYKEFATEELLDFYDEYGSEPLKGHCYKSFYRYADGSPIEFLVDGLNETPKTGFITYMDDALVNGDVPENVSVLVKTMRVREVMRETLASQILGTLGVPSCLDFAINPSKGWEKERLLASVDFVSYGEDFNTFLDLDIAVSDLEMTLKILDHDYELLGKEKLRVLKEDYIKSYLYRALLLCDFDFCEYNIGVLRKDKYNAKIINFDFEDSFGVLAIRTMEDINLDFISKRYPQVFKKFISDTCDLSVAIDEVKNEKMDSYQKTLLDTLKNNTTTIKEFYNEMFSAPLP